VKLYVATTFFDGVLENEPLKPRRKIRRRLALVIYKGIFSPAIILKNVYRQIIVLIILFLWGAAVLGYYNGLRPLQAILASVSTITTIGLYVPNGGNFNTIPTGETIHLIIIIIIAVGAGASILQGIISSIGNGDVTNAKAQKRLISQLRDHTVLFGDGDVARHVAEKLNDLGLDYVVLTNDPDHYHDLLTKDIFVILVSDKHPVEDLTEAGIERASTAIVAHDKDSINMLVILASRKLSPNIRIISVVNDEELVDTAKTAGADTAIPASRTIGSLVALSAVTRNMVGVVFSDKTGSREIAEFSIYNNSRLIGKGLQEISRYAPIMGVVRDDRILREVYEPNFVLKEADTLLILGNPRSLAELEHVSGQSSR